MRSRPRRVTRELAFVLSTGRTGTVFLSRLIGRAYARARCVHEPPPSRALLVAGNLRNQLGCGTAGLRALFESALARRLRRLGPGERYIEINPLMTTTLDLVAGLDAPLRVLHMVRDPRTWAPSIETFKASGYRRYLVDVVPFSKPVPINRPPRWSTLPALERALWRWRDCNEQLEARFGARARCRYRRVRYEDVFSTRAETRDEAVREALSALGLDPAPGLAALDTRARVNPAPTGARPRVDEVAVARICGELLARYGYAPGKR